MGGSADSVHGQDKDLEFSVRRLAVYAYGYAELDAGWVRQADNIITVLFSFGTEASKGLIEALESLGLGA